MTGTSPGCMVVPPGAGIVGRAAAPGLPSVEVKLGADAGAGFSVIEYTVPGGFSPPQQLHRQTREDTTVYVVSGRLHYRFADGDAVASAGTLVRLPRGVGYRWANEGTEPCRLIAIFTPGGFEQYFLDLSAAMADADGDRAVLGEVIGRLRRQYGDEDCPP